MSGDLQHLRLGGNDVAFRIEALDLDVRHEVADHPNGGLERRHHAAAHKHREGNPGVAIGAHDAAGVGEILVCLRGDGADDASAPRLQWKQEKSAADVPSPIVLGERLYVLTDGGILTCSATVNGRVQWKKRFHGDFSASPVATADRLYLANEEGVTFVVDGTSGNVLSENALLESIFATPAIGGDELLIRTDAALYSIRNARGSRGTLTQTSSETLRTSQNAAN